MSKKDKLKEILRLYKNYILREYGTEVYASCLSGVLLELDEEKAIKGIKKIFRKAKKRKSSL